MVSSTQKVGNRSEACLLAALTRRYDQLLLPFGDGSRYDIVADCPMEGFVRIQCKTGRYRKGAVLFNATSRHGHRGLPVRRYDGQADYFAVWCDELRRAYLVPTGHVTAQTASLRVDPTRNNQAARILWARDYEL